MCGVLREGEHLLVFYGGYGDHLWALKCLVAPLLMRRSACVHVLPSQAWMEAWTAHSRGWSASCFTIRTARKGGVSRPSGPSPRNPPFNKKEEQVFRGWLSASEKCQKVIKLSVKASKVCPRMRIRGLSRYFFDWHSGPEGPFETFKGIYRGLEALETLETMISLQRWRVVGARAASSSAAAYKKAAAEKGVERTAVPKGQGSGRGRPEDRSGNHKAIGLMLLEATFVWQEVQRSIDFALDSPPGLSSNRRSHIGGNKHISALSLLCVWRSGMLLWRHRSTPSWWGHHVPHMSLSNQGADNLMNLSSSCGTAHIMVAPTSLYKGSS